MNNAEEEIRKRGETDLQSRDTHQEQKMGARACQRRLLGHVSKGGEKTVLYVGKLLILHSTLQSLSRSPFTTTILNVPVHNRALPLQKLQRFLILSKKNDRPSIEKSSAFFQTPKTSPILASSDFQSQCIQA